jgi:hypothetical protein
MHKRYNSYVEECFAQGLSIANIDGQAIEKNQIEDAIPVMEKVQLHVHVAFYAETASSTPSSSGMRAVSCGLYTRNDPPFSGIVFTE